VRRLFVAIVVTLVAACGLSACGSSPSSGPAAAQVKQASTKVNSDLSAYLTVKAPPSLSPQGWQTFFSRGKKLVGNLASSFSAWSSLLDGSIKAGTWPVNVRLTEAYRDAFAQWVKDQQQQVTLSEACVGMDGINATTVAGIAQCYEGMLTKYYAKWHADTSKFNTLAAELREASG
jgi:hypothetical protein